MHNIWWRPVSHHQMHDVREHDTLHDVVTAMPEIEDTPLRVACEDAYQQTLAAIEAIAEMKGVSEIDITEYLARRLGDEAVRIRIASTLEEIAERDAGAGLL